MVFVVAAAALWLGLANVGVSLKADDVWSRNAVLASWPELIRALSEDVHPPLYFLLLKPVVALLGDSEPALRSLSVLFYWLACAAMYRLARRFLDSAGALLAAAAFATAPLASQTAELVRMYSLLALLAILSTTALVDFARRPSWQGAAAFATLTFLGTFTHLWYFCLLAGQALAVWMCARWQIWRVAIALSAGVAPYALLWLPVLLRQLDRSREAAAWLPWPHPGMLPNLAYLWLGPTLLLLPWIAWRWRRFRGISPQPAAWAFWLLAGTILPPLAISFYKPFFYPRFTIVAVPFVALLTGWMLRRTAGVQAAAALSVLASLVALGLKSLPEPCTGRWAAAQLLDRARPGDYVIYTGLSRPAVSYYLDRARPDRNWKEQSFPSEIDTHPGYEGSVRDPARVPALRQEAEALANRVRQAPAGTRVFFLEGRHPAVEALLNHALQAGGTLRTEPSTGCPTDGGGYFRSMSVWKHEPATHPNLERSERP